MSNTPRSIKEEPIDQNTGTINKTAINEQRREIIINESFDLSFYEETILDVGKDLIKDSITQSREFHKTMLGLTATFATLMASSFSILILGVSNQQLSSLQKMFLVVPVSLMLTSSTFFALGYYPRRGRIVLSNLTEILKERNRVLGMRKTFAVLGLLCFVLSILSLLTGILFLNFR